MFYTIWNDHFIAGIFEDFSAKIDVKCDGFLAQRSDGMSAQLLPTIKVILLPKPEVLFSKNKCTDIYKCLGKGMNMTTDLGTIIDRKT